MRNFKTLKTIVYGLCIVVMVWFIASFVDTILHNAGGDMTYIYAVWNLFEIMF